MSLQVAELRIYPVKSLRGVTLERVQVEPWGFRWDRRWMLVESDGRFITQREDLSLLQFRVSVEDEGLRVSAPNRGACFVPACAEESPIDVRVWKDEFAANTVCAEADAWFSAAIGRPCRLVKMPAEAPRQISPTYGQGAVSFADAMPILVLSESSLAELNTNLDEPVPVDRFRPNLILRGSEPYAEDGFEALTIGGVRLRSTKRCGRCLVTCTDQDTGERGTEPLRTLAERRLFDQNACMGMYFAPISCGEIAVGDDIRAT